MAKLRRRWIVASAITGAIVVAVGVIATYTTSTGRQTRDVAMPPPRATPAQVVTTFIDALNAHDCKTAQAVYVASTQAEARSWCDKVQHLGHVRVRPEVKDPESTTTTPLADVGVSFDLNWRPLHSDGSMPEGPTEWGYILTRASTRAPWRISSQGVD